MRIRARMNAAFIVLCLFCALGTAACGISSSLAAGRPAGPALHVTLVATLPSHQTLFEKDVRDAAAVQRLYDAALALPPPKPGIYNCPADNGKMYHLVFSGIQGHVRTIDVNVSGCPFIHLLETDKWRWMDQAFIALFEKTIGVSQLDPTAP